MDMVMLITKEDFRTRTLCRIMGMALCHGAVVSNDMLGMWAFSPVDQGLRGQRLTS